MIDVILQHKITHVDALLITHNHADATNGLDDLREFKDQRCADPFPIYAREPDIAKMLVSFPYLAPVPDEQKTPLFYRPHLAFRPFSELTPFTVCGIEFTPIQLEHSPGTATGFVFGKVAYLSDLNRLPEEGRAVIERRSPLDLLIIDALFDTSKTYPSHLNLGQALDQVRSLKPKKTLLIGMGHTFDYYANNERLKAEAAEIGFDVEVSYDGMRWPIELPDLAAVPSSPPA
jgi:phosphoribosyl 1,2-cyclic phosphodiesterase